MFMGVMQGLRNPGGHELDVRDRQEALEELSAASLLMRWLDTSRINEPITSTPRPRSQSPTPPSARPRTLKSFPSARLAVLQELRDMSHRQARTSAILELDVTALSSSSGIAENILQDTLVDLLAEGLVEPNAPTFAKSAEQGACRITGPGVHELASLTPEDGEAR
jgi:hypothetical protein